MGKLLVEFLGTLFLMFIILTTGNWLAIGSALSIEVFLGAAISGGAFNPAVAIALVHAGKMPASDLLQYILAQVAGALTAVEIVKRMKS